MPARETKNPVLNISLKDLLSLLSQFLYCFMQYFYIPYTSNFYNKFVNMERKLEIADRNLFSGDFVIPSLSFR